MLGGRGEKPDDGVEEDIRGQEQAGPGMAE